MGKYERKDGVFPGEPPRKDSERDRWGGVICGEIADCRARGYQVVYMPFHTAICGSENWPPEILEEYLGANHRACYGTPFISEENLTYEEELEGFRVIEDAESESGEEELELSSEESTMCEWEGSDCKWCGIQYKPNAENLCVKKKREAQEEIAAWVKERYGQVIMQMEYRRSSVAGPVTIKVESVEEKNLPIDVDVAEVDLPCGLSLFLEKKKCNSRKKIREINFFRQYCNKQRVETKKPARPFRPHRVALQQNKLKPKFSSDCPKILSIRLPKPAEPWPEPELEFFLHTEYGDLMNFPYELSSK